MVLSEYAHPLVAELSRGTSRSVCLDVGLPAILLALQTFAHVPAIQLHGAEFLMNLHRSAPPRERDAVLVSFTNEVERARVAGEKVAALRAADLLRGDSGVRDALDLYFETTGEEDPFEVVESPELAPE